VTGQSLLGRFGRTAQAFSEDLLKRNLVHFVASDGHDCRSRPPRLDDSREWVRREFGEAAAERLFVQNPRLVLSGEPLPDAEPVTETVERKWWRLWQ
jgi:protein-tyrosine phosphatase